MADPLKQAQRQVDHLVTTATRLTLERNEAQKRLAAVEALLDTPHDTEAGNDCIACNLPRLIRAVIEGRP